jgi:hypothetical protein
VRFIISEVLHVCDLYAYARPNMQSRKVPRRRDADSICHLFEPANLKMLNLNKCSKS